MLRFLTLHDSRPGGGRFRLEVTKNLKDKAHIPSLLSIPASTRLRSSLQNEIIKGIWGELYWAPRQRAEEISNYFDIHFSLFPLLGSFQAASYLSFSFMYFDSSEII